MQYATLAQQGAATLAGCKFGSGQYSVLAQDLQAVSLRCAAICAAIWDPTA